MKPYNLKNYYDLKSSKTVISTELKNDSVIQYPEIWKIYNKNKNYLVSMQRKTIPKKTPHFFSLNDRVGTSGEKQQAVLLAFLCS